MSTHKVIFRNTKRVVDAMIADGTLEPHIDAPIYPLIVALNRSKCMTTRWCCQGSLSSKDGTHSGRGYVMIYTPSPVSREIISLYGYIVDCISSTLCHRLGLTLQLNHGYNVGMNGIMQDGLRYVLEMVTRNIQKIIKINDLMPIEILCAVYRMLAFVVNRYHDGEPPVSVRAEHFVVANRPKNKEVIHE